MVTTVISIADPALALLADLALKGTTLLLIAVVVTRLMRRRSAASRHLVWALALGGLLAVPLLGALLPAWRVAVLPVAARPVVTAEPPSVPSVRAPSSTVREALPAPATAPPVMPDEESSAAPRADLVTSAPAAVASADIPWTRALLLLWGAGAIVMLARLLVGTLLVRRLTRNARPIKDPLWSEVIGGARRQLGISREVPLLAVDRVITPMTCGVLRPAIVVPRGGLAWPAERRRVVALHELAHIKRRDAAVEVLAQLAYALCWFHPLVWLAARELRAERERACDDQVLAFNTKPSAYADHLLEIVRTMGATNHAALASVAMARRSQFEGRLLAILDPNRRRDDISRAGRTLGASAAAILILPLAALNPWPGEPEFADPPSAPTMPAEPLAAAEPSQPSAPAPEAPLSPVAAVELPFRCAGENVRGTWIHTSAVDHDGENQRTRVILATDGRCLEMISEGRVTFTADERDIASMGANAFFSVSEEIGGRVRKLVARSGSGGIERRYTVDGTTREIDAEGRAWFAGILLRVIRETGYDAEGRVTRLLARGGTAAVLGEVDLIESSGGKSRYLDALLEARELSRDTLRLVASRVGRGVSSSGDKARLLSKIAQQPKADATLNTSLIEAAESISSSGDLRSVLTTIVENDGKETLIMAARAARKISSSGDKAALLLEIAERWVEDDTLRAEYLRSASSIPSSGDRTRVFLALLEQSTLSQPTLRALLESTAEISSSGDKTRVLVNVAEEYSLGEARVREAFYRAFTSVPSSGDGRRVLAAVLERDSISAPEIVEALEASQRIASSSDRAAVLLSVVENHGLRGAGVRDAFIKAAESLPSESDYRRVMSAATRGADGLQL